LDLLGEVSGGGSYEQLLPFSEEIEVFGGRFRFLSLEKPIQLKRAADRSKDLEMIAQLQAFLEERRNLESSESHRPDRLASKAFWESLGCATGR
jgi:predicted nucleotidyltransferase